MPRRYSVHIIGSRGRFFAAGEEVPSDVAVPQGVERPYRIREPDESDPGQVYLMTRHQRERGFAIRKNNPMPTTVIHVMRQHIAEGRPDTDVYIGHRFKPYGLPETIWANPYYYLDKCTQEEKVERFEAYLKTRPDLLARVHELKGKRLACWCKPEACHGDVLAKLADAS